MRSLESISYNTCLKLTPEGEALSCMVASRAIFRAKGWEERRGPARVKASRGKKPRQKDSPRGARRAKRRLYELARCNAFDIFVTWTLSPEKINRYDYKEVVRRFGIWLDNRVRRRGLRYIAVAEHHDDGAIHFHGLCNSDALKLVDSGHLDKKSGKVIYNLEDWELGFTTAVKLDGEYSAVCHYVSKYITKQNSAKCGGRWFLHGGKLREPVRLLGNVRDFQSVKGKELHFDEAGLSIKYCHDLKSLGGVTWASQQRDLFSGTQIPHHPTRGGKTHTATSTVTPPYVRISGAESLILSWLGWTRLPGNNGWWTTSDLASRLRSTTTRPERRGGSDELRRADGPRGAGLV